MIFALAALALTSFSLEKSVRADTTVLPHGARAFVYRHVEADVPGYFGNGGIWENNSVHEKLGLDIVETFSDNAKAVMSELKKSSPEVFENLELGSITIDPKVSAKADAFALAWGIGNNLMIGGILPYMQTEVVMTGGFQASDDVRRAEAQLRTYAEDPQRTDRSTMSAMAQVLSRIPAFTGSNLQDVLVNYYGYKPVGNWKASGMGDVTLFGQWRYGEDTNLKQAMKFSTELPTGRVDDVDNLADVPFGKGYFGTGIEFLNDLFVGGKDILVVAFNAKYQYNWEAQALRRLPPSRDFPLSKEKETVRWKPGDYWNLAVQADVKIYKQLRTYVEYGSAGKGADTYNGSKAGYDYSYLSKNSARMSQVVETGIYYSTVRHFLDKTFPVPFKVAVAYSQVIGGLNAENVRMGMATLELYF